MAKKKRRFGGKNGTVRRVLTGDDSPSSIPFYQRKWSLSSTKKSSFRVMSYNLLAQSLVTLTGPRCPTWALEWKYRSKNLLQEVLYFRASILCVQELDFDCAKTFNESLSREGNYDFKYKRRTGEDKSDGLCVYWNKLCWTCIHYTDVEFYHYDKDPLMDRHNVAQISVLKELSSGKIVIVANTHLLFNPKRGDVKFRQLEILLRELTKVHQKFTDSYVLLMGDFNSVPGSAMYEFLSKGQLSTIHLRDRKLISGQWNSKTMREYDQIEWTFDKRHLGRGTCMRLFQNDEIRKSDDTSDRNDDNKIIRHELSLQSAYSESGTMMTTGEPAFTTYHSRFKGTVDYIWFGNGLNCTRVLEMIPKTTLDRFRGLPSSKWSSDHMSLCVEFEFLSSPSLKSEKYEKQQYTKVKIDEDEWPSL